MSFTFRFIHIRWSYLIFILFTFNLHAAELTRNTDLEDTQEFSDYRGYTLYGFKVDNNSTIFRKLKDIEEQYHQKHKTTKWQYDIWWQATATNRTTQILISPGIDAFFKDSLTPNENATLTIIEKDIPRIIYKEISNVRKLNYRSKRNTLTNWENFDIHMYHSYDKMVEFIKKLGEQKSDMVDVNKVATSFEGRKIYAVKIHPPNVTKPERPSIIIDAGVHAREWIAPAVALYMIKKLVSDYGKDDEVTKSLEKFDWYIIPQVNPDGYEYSRTTDRLWRKTRSINSTVNKWCTGADANRNWGYRWGEVGSVRTPCSNIYMGSHPYSEPEIRGLKDFYTWQIANPVVYISLHSYGQLFLAPWGYTSEKTQNYKDQQLAARAAVRAMRNKTGVSYNFGTISELMYPASGTSIDYMQHLGVPYIYGVELRPNDSPNGFAFNLPPEYISITGNEMLSALFAIGEHAIKVKKL